MQPLNFNRPVTYGYTPDAPEYPYLQKLDQIIEILEGEIPNTPVGQSKLVADFQEVLKGLEVMPTKPMSREIMVKINAVRTRLEGVISQQTQAMDAASLDLRNRIRNIDG